MRIKLLLVLCFTSLIINAQNHYNMDELTVTSEFEIFDTKKFEEIKKSTLTAWEILDNGSQIYMTKVKAGCSYSVVPKDSYFGLKKIYYTNGKIKEKGLGFIYDGFKKGTWYYFDEKGNLTDSIDHDKPFKFTFEDVLTFAEKEGIIFMKSPIDIEYYTPLVPELIRHYDHAINKGFWQITWFNRELEKVEEIQLDAETGEVLARDYGEYIL